MNALYQWGLSLPTAGLYAFIFAWLFVESTGFPISDEPLLLLAGSLAFGGKLQLALVILLALLGKVAASCLAYWIGQRFALDRLARPARRPAVGIGRWLYYLRPTPAFALAVELRFRRQGAWGVFLGRLIPVVRSFISYPAGAARMPFGLFLLATTAGSLLWIVGWTVGGATMGAAYRALQARLGGASLLALAAALILGAALWYWNHRRSERRLHALAHEALNAAPAGDSAPAVSPRLPQRLPPAAPAPRPPRRYAASGARRKRTQAGRRR